MSRMERRRKIRVKTEKFSIEYRFLSDDFMTTASVINASESGICFLRQSPINKNDQIEVMIPFKSGNIFLKARVARVDGREVGIMFTDNPDKINNFYLGFDREYRIIRNTESDGRQNSSENSDDIDDLLSDI